MAIAVLGIDLGKNSCSVVGLDGTGQVILRRHMQRKSIAVLGAKLSPCIIAMEACCDAHHLGRVLSTLGHTVRLMSPEYVRPYVKVQKNDDRDAEAIAEAATRPTMRFVALKSRRTTGHADPASNPRSGSRRTDVFDEPVTRYSARARSNRTARSRQITTSGHRASAAKY